MLLLLFAYLHIFPFSFIFILIFVFIKLFVLFIYFHHLQYLLYWLFLNHLFDAYGINILPLFHLKVDLCEIVGISNRVEDLIFGRKSKLDESSGYFAHLELHYFLKIDISQIVHYPFYLHMIDVYPRCHV